ncbi:predicted protein [Lichtheimia corymbifera JMRC:FSU:9682]|uniref:Uncharacterized protein n=1 Tax=Lichtheimia corymbifera JMRC:FSU:9682 TaxID=1263082 RepID=A0A068RJH0_9FUNG|nr:predicted protein [Lichtheimia corymbifera JMRC:FSU:9682]
MPTENDIPPQYRRVRISTIDDDELLNKLAELEKTTKEEMEALREEIRSLKALIHKLVDDQGVVVSSRPTPKKRRLVQISEADDDDSEDMMIPHMPVMQNGPIPSQSPLDDNDNEKEDAGHEEEQDDNDNVNDNDNNDGDAVGDAGKEVVEDDNDQEMQEEYQPPNSYGEELFDELAV